MNHACHPQCFIINFLLPDSLQLKTTLLQILAQTREHQWSRTLNDWWQLVQQLLTRVRVPLMLGAEPFLGPSRRIPAVAASTDISLEPHLMPLMISFFEAILADDAGRVFLACFALPCHIPVGHCLGADSIRGLILV